MAVIFFYSRLYMYMMFISNSNCFNFLTFQKYLLIEKDYIFTKWNFLALVQFIKCKTNKFKFTFNFWKNKWIATFTTNFAWKPKIQFPQIQTFFLSTLCLKTKCKQTEKDKFNIWPPQIFCNNFYIIKSSFDYCYLLKSLKQKEQVYFCLFLIKVNKSVAICQVFELNLKYKLFFNQKKFIIVFEKLVKTWKIRRSIDFKTIFGLKK